MADHGRTAAARPSHADNTELRAPETSWPCGYCSACAFARIELLSARWDALLDNDAPAPERREVLAALLDRVLERNYINNLLAGIERELNS